MTNKDGEPELHIIANCAYSYEVIRTCAFAVRDRVSMDDNGRNVLKWRENKYTRDLKFTNPWVWGFLKRQKLVCRRVTSSTTQSPLSDQEVNQHMRDIIQAVILEHELGPEHVFNSDETGIHWAEEIKYQYVAKNAERAQAPPGDETGRFTALLGSN